MCGRERRDQQGDRREPSRAARYHAHRTSAVGSLAARGRERELYGPATSGEIAALERDDYNAWVVAQNRDRPLDDVLADGQEAFRRLLKVVHVLTDEQITDAHRFAFTGGRPLWQWLPDQSYQHYRMHIPAIRRWLDRRER